MIIGIVSFGDQLKPMSLITIKIPLATIKPGKLYKVYTSFGRPSNYFYYYDKRGYEYVQFIDSNDKNVVLALEKPDWYRCPFNTENHEMLFKALYIDKIMYIKVSNTWQ